MESSRKNNSAVQGASVQQARDASSSADSKAAFAASFLYCSSGLRYRLCRDFYRLPIAWRGSYRVLCRCYELVLLLRVLSNDEARRQGPQ